MTRGLEALYRDVILDHNKRPRNVGVLEGGGKAEGSNPLCGDRLTVYVRLANGTIHEAAFQGFGCAIAIASASLMTESVKGKALSEAQALFGAREMCDAAMAGAACRRGRARRGRLHGIAARRGIVPVREGGWRGST